MRKKKRNAGRTTRKIRKNKKLGNGVEVIIFIIDSSISKHGVRLVD